MREHSRPWPTHCRPGSSRPLRHPRRQWCWLGSFRALRLVHLRGQAGSSRACRHPCRRLGSSRARRRASRGPRP
ncbi:hypothetical protein BC567DRAFT_227528 [Phyllosticta citribraziliensis]